MEILRLREVKSFCPSDRVVLQIQYSDCKPSTLFTLLITNLILPMCN